MFDWIASIFQYPMQWFYSFTGSYVVSLILFALLVRILFLPLSIHQQKLQIKGAKLRPRIAIIEKKYEGRTDPESRQKMQQEIMEFQQKEGYSPFAGCLPMLLQLPVIMGIYQIVRKPLSYLMRLEGPTITGMKDALANAFANKYPGLNFDSLMEDQIRMISIIKETPGYSFPTDIAEQIHSPFPDLSFFGLFDMGQAPSLGNWANWPLLLIPVLTFALAYGSMKLTRKLNPAPTAAASADAAASNKIMEFSMPIMSAVFTFMVPGAVGFYWLVGYVFSMLQTVMLAKLMPLPTFTEEEIRQYEKEMKASKAISRQAAAQQAKIRSRHHIDDEDYESAPLPPSQQKKHDTAKKSGIEAAPQKKNEK
ncbi:MAG: membrane protein insertase YidC [Clostridia bacterium]|nr:membrane protein insertase YidC [Clostridia bacterium]